MTALIKPQLFYWAVLETSLEDRVSHLVASRYLPNQQDERKHRRLATIWAKSSPCQAGDGLFSPSYQLVVNSAHHLHLTYSPNEKHNHKVSTLSYRPIQPYATLDALLIGWLIF